MTVTVVGNRRPWRRHQRPSHSGQCSLDRVTVPRRASALTAADAHQSRSKQLRDRRRPELDGIRSDGTPCFLFQGGAFMATRPGCRSPGEVPPAGTSPSSGGESGARSVDTSSCDEIAVDIRRGTARSRGRASPGAGIRRRGRGAPNRGPCVASAITRWSDGRRAPAMTQAGRRSPSMVPRAEPSVAITRPRAAQPQRPARSMRWAASRAKNLRAGPSRGSPYTRLGCSSAEALSMPTH